MRGFLAAGLALLGSLGIAAKAEAVVYDFTRTAATEDNFPDATYRNSVTCSTIGCVGPNAVLTPGFPLPVLHTPPAAYGDKVQGEGTSETLTAPNALLDIGLLSPQTTKLKLAHDGLLRITYAFYGLANANVLSSFTLNGQLVGGGLVGVSIAGGIAYTYEDTNASAGNYTAVFTSLASLGTITGQAVTVVTPVPAALPLMGSALLGFSGFAAWRRRRGANDAGHGEAMAA